jgi:hypothetical protein
MITVITPSIGTKYLQRAIRSVRAQTVPCRHIIVADGTKHYQDVLFQAHEAWDGTTPAPEVYCIPDNTGKEKWNGHKIYAHFSQLLDTDFLALLDEDNEFLPNHIESLHERADKYGFAWSYRNIYLGSEYIGKDVRESIGAGKYVGYDLVDTSSWMFRRDNLDLLSGILVPWEGDRTLTRMLKQYSGDKFYSACTTQHTMNYYAPLDKADFYRSICQ